MRPVLLLVSGCLPWVLAMPAFAQEKPGSAAITRVEVIQAEAARAASPEQLELLIRAASSASPIQALAIRALGRLERPGLVETLLPRLADQQAAARAAAADALAQSVGRDLAAARKVRDALLERLLGEQDADALGAVGEALGRLPLEGGGASPAAEGAGQEAAANEKVEKALVAIASHVEVTSRIEKQAAGGRIIGLTIAPKREALVPMPALLGALRGLESMARAKGRARASFLPDTVQRLRALLFDDPATSDSRNRGGSRQADAARARRLALLSLLPVNAVSPDIVARALADSDVQVRRLAVSSAAADRTAVDKGLKDAAWLVRYEALRTYGRRFQPSEGCGPILDAIGNQVDHVSLLALDLLGNPCKPEDHSVERLLDLALQASGLPSASGASNASPKSSSPPDWHRPAHAIVSLAKAAPNRARPYILRFLSVEPWQYRMYAATAATLAGETEALRRLATDADDNVRNEAIAGLSKTVGHDADGLYIQALSAADFQLVMTAASALRGTTDRAAAVPALLTALDRLTALDSDPSRDPRVAVLDRLEELGSRDQADRLKPYLTDTDPRVAAIAARILTAWNGAPVAPAPRPRPAALPPLTEELLERLARTTVRVTMEGGGEFEVKLLVDLAPVSSALFVERAARGFYTGLTFHRVLPNFLIQGGSPGANEYMGDRRYMIDEPGRTSQTRGTVGSSTRGRDTGDGQFYINLVDTPRLDHEYSIFGEVVRGMDVVDRILEGEVMKKVEVRR